jgi:hypothetical protein
LIGFAGFAGEERKTRKMKKTFIGVLIGLLLLSISVTAQAGRALYNKLKDLYQGTIDFKKSGYKMGPNKVKKGASISW